MHRFIAIIVLLSLALAYGQVHFDIFSSVKAIFQESLAGEECRSSSKRFEKLDRYNSVLSALQRHNGLASKHKGSIDFLSLTYVQAPTKIWRISLEDFAENDYENIILRLVVNDFSSVSTTINEPGVAYRKRYLDEYIAENIERETYTEILGVFNEIASFDDSKLQNRSKDIDTDTLFVSTTIDGQFVFSGFEEGTDQFDENFNKIDKLIKLACEKFISFEGSDSEISLNHCSE